MVAISFDPTGIGTILMLRPRFGDPFAIRVAYRRDSQVSGCQMVSAKRLESRTAPDLGFLENRLQNEHFDDEAYHVDTERFLAVEGAFLRES